MYEEDLSPRCLPGTRVDELSEILRWATSPNSETIFWLSGQWEMGKSTISRSVAYELDGSGHLGASLFFTDDVEAKTAPITSFFTTIAVQMAIKKPGLAPYIKEAIDAEPTVAGMESKDQFDILIRSPLRRFLSDSQLKLFHRHSPHSFEEDTKVQRPMIIILNAVEACQFFQDGRAKDWINLFTSDETVRHVLRVFITGWPDPLCSVGGAYPGISLHEIAKDVIQGDFTLFFDHELTTIRKSSDLIDAPDGPERLPPNWPGPSKIDQLVKMAIPFFGVAASICRFIKSGPPNVMLQAVLAIDTPSKLRQSNHELTVIHSRIRQAETRRRSLHGVWDS
ncbi:hypothetical protein XA68_17163 [Ophiocordyceps unilateralis]|uniref:Nephrocystin 3-like N-terminal domain-containing protein n=1 Tax=Ophiocordyceps unilateralis TaxID=268505 RepID=A0A2A9PL09_OPHUN|nr:hypothetical protein XA68_17163 [Ophiocordyceps unilateralis]